MAIIVRTIASVQRYWNSQLRSWYQPELYKSISCVEYSEVLTIAIMIILTYLRELPRLGSEAASCISRALHKPSRAAGKLGNYHCRHHPPPTYMAQNTLVRKPKARVSPLRPSSKH